MVTQNHTQHHAMYRPTIRRPDNFLQKYPIQT